MPTEPSQAQILRSQIDQMLTNCDTYGAATGGFAREHYSKNKLPKNRTQFRNFKQTPMLLLYAERISREGSNTNRQLVCGFRKSTLPTKTKEDKYGPSLEFAQTSVQKTCSFQDAALRFLRPTADESQIEKDWTKACDATMALAALCIKHPTVSIKMTEEEVEKVMPQGGELRPDASFLYQGVSYQSYASKNGEVVPCWATDPKLVAALQMSYADDDEYRTQLKALPEALDMHSENRMSVMIKDMQAWE